eukprot:COSAG01_NODE_20876_length_930_cov_1.293622_1_plen_223_part_10
MHPAAAGRRLGRAAAYTVCRVPSPRGSYNTYYVMMGSSNNSHQLSGLLLLLCTAAAVSASSAAIPGLWFWGSASDVSLSAIATFQQSLASRAPRIYYSVSGCKFQTTGIDCSSFNHTKCAAMKAMQIYPHATVGATNITELRAVFANPEPFIHQSVQSLKAAGVTGVNLDWEPYQHGMTKWSRDDGGDVSNADGLKYAAFLDMFAHSLHEASIEISLDFFTDL